MLPKPITDKKDSRQSHLQLTYPPNTERDEFISLAKEETEDPEEARPNCFGCEFQLAILTTYQWMELQESYKRPVSPMTFFLSSVLCLIR